jgi:hypothetical protein
MKKLLRAVATHREVRASAASAVTTSTTVPNSGLTSVVNAQGASAAAAELSRTLDDVLDGLDLRGVSFPKMRVH